jgi:membrane carboxypeptidase/penicillin-binding protein PbpC
VALLIPGLSPTEQEVPMEADSGASSAALSWFVDGAFLGTAASAERVWWAPSVGVHEIVVMDEAGRSDHRSLVVRAP